MTTNIGKQLIEQARAADDGKRGATVKVDAETLRILEKWPLGRTLKDRARQLIFAADEYLESLDSQQGPEQR